MIFNPPLTTAQVPKFPGTSSITEFSFTSTPTQVLPDRSSAANRRGLVLYIDGTANALFSYGTSISSASFTAELVPGGYAEDNPSAPWQGPIFMRATSNPTTVNVTEIVII